MTRAMFIDSKETAIDPKLDGQKKSVPQYTYTLESCSTDKVK